MRNVSAHCLYKGNPPFQNYVDLNSRAYCGVLKLLKLRTHLVRQFAWVDNTGGDIKKRSYQPAVPPFRRHGLSEFPLSSVSSFSPRFHTRALALDFLTLCRPSKTLLPYLALNSQRKRSMKGVSAAPGNSAEK